MDWFDRHDDRYYETILRLLDTWNDQNYVFRWFVSELDEALNIWNSEPQDWSDPYLLKWAAILNRYGVPYYQDEATLSDEELAQFASAVAGLREKSLEAYEQYQCRQMLAAIRGYEQGKLNADRLMRRLRSGVYGLEEFARGELHAAIQDKLWEFEDAYDIYSAYRMDQLNSQGRKRIAGIVAHIKDLIEPAITR